MHRRSHLFTQPNVCDSPIESTHTQETSFGCVKIDRNALAFDFLWSKSRLACAKQNYLLQIMRIMNRTRSFSHTRESESNVAKLTHSRNLFRVSRLASCLCRDTLAVVCATHRRFYFKQNFGPSDEWSATSSSTMHTYKHADTRRTAMRAAERVSCEYLRENDDRLKSSSLE